MGDKGLEDIDAGESRVGGISSLAIVCEGDEGNKEAKHHTFHTASGQERGQILRRG
jgi:hypothetical protein